MFVVRLLKMVFVLCRLRVYMLIRVGRNYS